MSHQSDLLGAALLLQGHLREIPLAKRSIPMIAAEINTHMLQALFKKPGKVPSWVRYSRPYLDALRRCNSLDDMYGAENCRSIILYLLNNLTTWRGEDARRIKAELNNLLNPKE